MKVQNALTVAVILLGMAGAGVAAFSLAHFKLPSSRVLATPVGDVGSSATQVQQSSFDQLLKKLNERIDSEHQSELSWATAQQRWGWAALVINVLLIAFAYFTGKPVPIVKAENAGPEPPPRTWDSWAMLLLATFAMGIKALDQHIEGLKTGNGVTINRLYEATIQGRIAFADAKNDKEYDSAIGILRKADLDIK